MEDFRKMLNVSIFLFLSVFTLGILAEEPVANVTANTREGRAILPIFQVVQFPNDPCSGSSSRNGTCYTAEECASRGGSSSGSCASGFGVCCTFTLSCGSTTMENCTYLVQDLTSAAPTPDPCVYKVCKSNSNICRIRFDFNTFNIAGPVVGTVVQNGAASSVNGGSIGDCATDTFSITAPGNNGSPIICGFNTGQHMIVDASDACHAAAFDIGGGSTQRQWDIKVTQYTCNDERGGPQGCLQYFTGTTGTISSFNFPTTSTTLDASVTHLSSQRYNACFRQEASQCAICFLTAVMGMAIMAADQFSFGLGVSLDDAAPQSSTVCTMDYLTLIGAQAAPVTQGAITPMGVTRLCGRYFDSTGAMTAATNSVCTQTRPFVLGVNFDADEVAVVETANKATKNEQSNAPGGIVGFSLLYAQQACT